MRSLSFRQISDCEHARTNRCRCRCGGKLHGIKRGDGETFFEALPVDDPHFLPTEEERKTRKRTKTRERKQRQYQRLIGMR